ncbi:MAG TPA: heparinase II/III family protein, partial [Bacteroidota bacterium]|nr:heparinase II/III family protein [Bacteroidota bacterium]
MPTTRRDFLKAGAIAAAGLPLIPVFHRTSPGAPAPSAPPSGGLFFDESDIPRIRQALRQPHVAAYWKSITGADLAADTNFIRSEAKLNNHSKDMLRVRQILERTSFIYALTSDAAQGEVARRALDKILEYPKWDYFLEGGEDVIGLQRAPEATIAMSCAREWLGAAISKETAAEVERQIGEKGAPACYRTLYGMKYPDRVRGWGFDPEDDYPFHVDMHRWPLILNSTNLKAIPIAGLGIAGCLLKGKHPQAEQWISLAEQSARAFALMYGPDGAYDEGVGYWGYTSTHLTLLVEVFRRKLGRDVAGMLNYPGTVRYGLRMWMQTAGRPNDCVDFGDAWAMGDVSVAAWTAGRFKDPVAQYVATHVGEPASPWSVIWLDPALEAEKPGPDLFDVRFSNDLVVSRSGWEESDGVVALRSGGPANHEHADRNSVIFKAHGERIYHDPYHAAYPYTDPLWVLRLTKSHSALLVDGKGHQYHDGHEGTNASLAESHVVEYRSDARSMVLTSDATAAYRLVNQAIALVRRTLVFLKPDVLVVVDRVRLTGKPLPVQARFQIDNSDGKGSVSADAGSFTVLRPNASARALVFAGAGVAVRTGNLDIPAEKGVFPYAEVESAPSLDHVMLTVCAVKAASASGPVLHCAREGELWRITGERGGAPVAVT